MPDADMRTVNLPSGEPVPVLGLGTWYMGEDPGRREEELESLRLGLDLGMTLVDTAEMYGDGAAEELVGAAIKGRRDEVFLVSKVLPSNAGKDDTVQACEDSLRRLQTDRLDLYLLHWPGSTPLEETLEAFASLADSGKVRFWGVSNFDVDEMSKLVEVPGGGAVATDQVLYNLTRRGIEADLVPWCQDQGLPVMAYAPVEQGRLLDQAVLEEVAARHDATASQVALAWVLRKDGFFTIPKAAQPAHVRENRGALDVQLGDDDLAELDEAFPAPSEPQPLEIL